MTFLLLVNNIKNGHIAIKKNVVKNIQDVKCQHFMNRIDSKRSWTDFTRDVHGIHRELIKLLIT